MKSITAESIIYIQKLSEIPKAKFPISLSGKLRAKVIKLSPVLIHWESMCLLTGSLKNKRPALARTLHQGYLGDKEVQEDDHGCLDDLQPFLSFLKFNF